MRKTEKPDGSVLDGKQKRTHNVKWNGVETIQLEMQLKMAIE